MIRIDDPARLGPAIEDLRTMLGVSRRSLARAVGNATCRDTDSINSQLWAWERGHRSPHPESLAAVLAELGYALAFVPMIETGPEEAPGSTESAEQASGVDGEGRGDSNGSTGRTEAVALLEYALHLRQYGERAPGGNETWREFDQRADMLLRELSGDPEAFAVQPPHPTCIDVTGSDQTPRSEWVCGPECPEEA